MTMPRRIFATLNRLAIRIVWRGIALPLGRLADRLDSARRRLRRFNARATADESRFRAYRCPGCGGLCCRPLRGRPKPCDRCGLELGGVPFRVEDRMRFSERIIEAAKEGREIE